MTLLYKEAGNIVAVSPTKATAYLNCIICDLHTNKRLERILPSSTKAKMAVIELAKNGYYDACKCEVRVCS